MKTLKPLIVVMIAFWCIDAHANTCGPPKRLKVKNVCGIVIDDSGKPIEGAILKLVAADGKNVTAEVTSQSNGQWFLNDAPKGEFLLLVSAQSHNSIKWPLQITARQKDGKCTEPLKVHLAGKLGWGCFDWVSRK
jgi:hypothetical protein